MKVWLGGEHTDNVCPRCISVVYLHVRADEARAMTRIDLETAEIADFGTKESNPPSQETASIREGGALAMRTASCKDAAEKKDAASKEKLVKPPPSRKKTGRGGQPKIAACA